MRIETHFQMYVVDGQVRGTGTAATTAKRSLRRPRRGPRPAPPGPGIVTTIFPPPRRGRFAT